MHVDRSRLPSALRWLFPFALAAGVALELARPFRAGRWRSMRLWPASIDVAAGNPAPGQVVFHDLRADGTGAGILQLETSQPTQRGQSLIVPLVANPDRGFWIMRIDAAS